MTNFGVILAGLLGGGLAGAIVSIIVSTVQRQRRRLAYWAALDVEVDLCAGFARVYTSQDAPASPLYRLSTIAYESAFPALLGDGVTSREDTRCLLRFYGQVVQINRGLDHIQAALSGPHDAAPSVVNEISRVRLKATALVDPNCTDDGGPYLSSVRAAIKRHLH